MVLLLFLYYVYNASVRNLQYTNVLTINHLNLDAFCIVKWEKLKMNYRYDICNNIMLLCLTYYIEKFRINELRKNYNLFLI